MSKPEARATGPTTPHSIACSLVNGPIPPIRPFAVTLFMKAGHDIFLNDLGHRLHGFDRRLRVGDIPVHPTDTVHTVVHAVAGDGFQQVHDLFAQACRLP